MIREIGDIVSCHSQSKSNVQFLPESRSGSHRGLRTVPFFFFFYRYT